MGVGELGNELEIVGEEGSSILQRRQDEYALVPDEGLVARGYGVQVDVLDRGRFDLERLMVVEDDGCLHVSIPYSMFVRRHLHGGLIRTPAANTRTRSAKGF